MKLYIGKSNFLITNNLLDLKTVELNKLLDLKSDLETIALKALMVMPGLLLQKTFLNSKSKENTETLKRRFSL